MILNQSIAALRVLPIRLLTPGGLGLPLNTVFAVGDAKISINGGLFVNTVNLPVSVPGGATGTFNLQLDLSEISANGEIRVQIVSAAVAFFEDVEPIEPTYGPGLALLAGQPTASLRALSVRLLTPGGLGLPLNTVFSVGDAKVSLNGATFVNSVNLPIALVGGAAGSFNLQLDVTEVPAPGQIRIQIVSAAVAFFETTKVITPAPATPATISWSHVISVAPELSGSVIADLAQQMILSVANTKLDSNGWGGETSTLLQLARSYLAAHMATLQRRKGVGGAVASRAAGGLSVSFSAPPLSSSMLSTTSYGQLYLQLARTRAFRAGVTTSRGNVGVAGMWNDGGVL